MKSAYITVTGTNHYFGTDFIRPKMQLKLIKEPDNKHDKEAIRVELPGLGKIGYVANSPYTVQGESMSVYTIRMKRSTTPSPMQRDYRLNSEIVSLRTY